MQRKKIKIELIETNEGQIEGVPSNPRFIKDAEFEKLKQSIIDFPEMLQIREVVVYPLQGKYVALGGNMRFRACKDLGYKEVDCVVLPQNMTVEKMREFAIKDNSGFGSWDFDMLANEWDEILLDMANVKIPNLEGIAGDNFGDEFSLKDGDREKFQQMTFTFSDQQAEQIKAKIGQIKNSDIYKNYESENENTNGNALYLLVAQWEEQRI